MEIHIFYQFIIEYLTLKNRIKIKVGSSRIYYVKNEKLAISMKLKKVLFIGCILSLSIHTIFSQNQLTVYPAPKEDVEMKNDFTVKVREVGKDWQNVDTYSVKVDEVRGIRHHVEKASLAYFDFEGEVEVSVTYNNGKVDSGKVRPVSYDITPAIDNNSLLFKLDRPRNLSVEVNGDIFHNLHLFANPIDKNKPKKIKDKNLIYFGPGVHQLPSDSLMLTSGKTVYIAGGAVVYGCIYAKNVEDVKILGRGRIHPRGRGAGVAVANAKNVAVDGIITTQVPIGGSDGVTITNVKAISSYGWGDGMNVFASNNVLYDGVFCRNSDDCTTVYGKRFEYTGGCKNITMQNSTLWADVAHPIFIGIHGNTDDPEVLENLNYVNIDILDHKEKQLNYQGCMSINAGDNNTIRNVRFEDIRVENFRQGQLVNLRIFYNEKYCTAPGMGIEDISFKNISYNGDNANVSIIEGYNESRKVRNISFENLKINGKYIYDEMPDKPKWYHTGDMADIYVGPHVENVTFTKTHED